MRFWAGVVLLAAVLSGCAGRRATKATEAVSEKAAPAVNITLDRAAAETYKVGDVVEVGFAADVKVDSVSVAVSGTGIGVTELSFDGYSGKYLLKTSGDSKLGKVSYRFIIYSGGKEYVRSGSFTLLAAKAPERYEIEVKKVIPQEKNYFVQGMEIDEGKMYMSSGQYGKSFVDILELPSMKVLRTHPLERKYFAEGLTLLDGKLYGLTWREGKCFVLDPNTLDNIGEFSYKYEGWGLANDGKYLYMSDGSRNIYKIDPSDFKEIDRIEVTSERGTYQYINELEWVNGEIWANVFGEDFILRIDPATGAIVGVVFCDELMKHVTIGSVEDVLNGIAFDKNNGDIYLSGKNWKKIFKVALVPEKI